jgi:hypothetical protein
MTTTLVLYFLSGLFAREDVILDTPRTIAGLFPVKQLVEALVVAYDPATTGTGLAWTDIAVLAAGASAPSSSRCACSAGHPRPDRPGRNSRTDNHEGDRPARVRRPSRAGCEGDRRAGDREGDVLSRVRVAGVSYADGVFTRGVHTSPASSRAGCGD